MSFEEKSDEGYLDTNGGKDAPVHSPELTDDPESDRRITRKFDLHILPWIFVLWLLAFIDRSNIGELMQSSLFEEITR